MFCSAPVDLLSIIGPQINSNKSFFMPEWIGKTIGKVRVDKELAKGENGRGYPGMHLTLDRPAAINETVAP